VGVTVGPKRLRPILQDSSQEKYIIIHDDSEDDCEIEYLGTNTSLVARNSNKRESTTFWDSSTSYHISGGLAEKNTNQHRGTQNRKIPAVCITHAAARTHELVEIINPDASADDLLQKLLHHIDCRYSLLSHQYEGVRKTAGLESTYPKDVIEIIMQSSLGLTWDAVLSKSQLTRRRGILMADVMGLGKVNTILHSNSFL
jgi:hypothetical protein